MAEPNAAKHIAQLRTELEERFGKLNSLQLWTLTKIAKRVRMRCRSNIAFNNLMNQLFPHAEFHTVQKERKSYRTGQMEKYDGLEISVEGEGVVSEDESEE